MTTLQQNWHLNQKQNNVEQIRNYKNKINVKAGKL